MNSSAAGAVTQAAVRTDPEYDLTESTYAVPNVYEYATLGPNEQMVTVNFSAVVTTHFSPCWLLIINLQLFVYIVFTFFDHQLSLHGFIN